MGVSRIVSVDVPRNTEGRVSHPLARYNQWTTVFGQPSEWELLRRGMDVHTNFLFEDEPL